MSKPKQYIKTIGIVIGCFLILATLTRLFLDHYNAISKYSYTNLAAGSTTIGNICEGVEVVQEFPYQTGDVGVAVQFATYARRNNGDVTLRIIGKTTQNTYLDMTKPASDFIDNAYMDLCYEGEIAAEDKTLQLVITSTSTGGEGLTIWTTEGDAIDGYDLTVNGESIAGDLTISRMNQTVRYRFSWIVYAMLMITLVTFLILSLKSGIRIETLYLVLALGLGVIYMFTMTPFAIPDEPNHYQSSFRLSNVLCFQWNNLNSGDARFFDYSSFVGHHNVGSGYERILSDIFSPGKSLGMIEIPTPYQITYPVMLLPQAIGIAIGRLFNANFLITFYLGRLCNLVFFALCVYFAIRKTTRFKLLFFILGIMPMALHQAASYSYDSFINGTTILFIALVIKTIDGDGPISLKEFMPVAITGLLLCPAKVIYSLVLLMLFLIPKRRFRNSRRYFISIGAVALLGLIAILITQLPSMLYVAKSAGAGTGNAAENWEGGRNYTLSFILHHPMQTLQIFSTTLKLRGWDWLLESIGRVFAGYSFLNEDRPIILYLFILVLSAFLYETDSRSITAAERMFFFIIPFGMILATMLSMFLVWTSDTSYIINGVQGRYFIPALPLLLMSLNNRMVKLCKPIERVLPLLAALLNVEVIYHVLFLTMSL